MAIPGRLDDFVKGYDDVSKVFAQTQSQSQIGGRKRTGHSNRESFKIFDRQLPPRDDHRPIAITHARPAWTEDIFIGEIGVSMNTDGRQLELARHCTAIERFDIDKLMAEFKRTRVD